MFNSWWNEHENSSAKWDSYQKKLSASFESGIQFVCASEVFPNSNLQDTSESCRKVVAIYSEKTTFIETRVHF